MKKRIVVMPIETKANGSIETFEVYSKKLGKTIQVSLTRPKDLRLLCDRGVVMISPEPIAA